MADLDDAGRAAEALSAVVDGVVAAPDTTADPLHLAYLRGAADALAMVAETPERDRPDTNESGHHDQRATVEPSAQVD